MALTAEQRAAVRRFLGWSMRHGQTDTRLEGAMNQLANQPADEAEVVKFLDELHEIEEQIKTTRSRYHVKQLGGLKLSFIGQLKGLRSEGRRLAGQLAHKLGVPKRGDAFGGSSGFHQGPYGPEGGGNYAPHG